jgi:hypothetical protein
MTYDQTCRWSAAATREDRTTRLLPNIQAIDTVFPALRLGCNKMTRVDSKCRARLIWKYFSRVISASLPNLARSIKGIRCHVDQDASSKVDHEITAGNHALCSSRHATSKSCVRHVEYYDGSSNGPALIVSQRADCFLEICFTSLYTDF